MRWAAGARDEGAARENRQVRRSLPQFQDAVDVDVDVSGLAVYDRNTVRILHLGKPMRGVSDIGNGSSSGSDVKTGVVSNDFCCWT